MSLSTTLLSQNERINCIVFIDGKLPSGVFDEYFIYTDSVGNLKKIDFEYAIGEIILSPDNKKTLDLLSPHADITINLSYKKYSGQVCTYSGAIKVAFLYYDYLVIRITNLDKKTGEYYFGYSTPGETKKFINKEYNMFEEF
jgi:hypothetical protein